MTNTPDTCPNAPDGKHRYFIYRVVDEYELYEGIDKPYDESVYTKTQYALSGCNCGKAVKRKIELGGDI